MYLLNFLVLMVEEEHKQISTMSNICLTDRREAEATNGLAQPVEPLCSINRMQIEASNINSQPVELNPQPVELESKGGTGQSFNRLNCLLNRSNMEETQL